MTRENKIGLALAFLLGLGDVAILGALAGDGGTEKPPAFIVVTSVVLGLATLVLVALAWRNPTRPLIISIIVLRALSGLGSVAGLGEGGAIMVVSLLFVVVTVVCIALLRKRIRRPVGAASGHAVR
jgi:drug/metabolite transporter (DMT)-like permease